jgi:catechol 2,3-dioxygenase-like lactoylglutathione lyase family enzyme
MAEPPFAVDHVGIRVPDVEAAATDLARRFGFVREGSELAPGTTIQVVFLRLGDTLVEAFEVPGEPARLDHLGLPHVGDTEGWCRRVPGTRGGEAMWMETRETSGIPMHLIAW